MNVAFDSRAAKDSRGVGRYARSLLGALVESGRGGLIETHAPSRDHSAVYHSPWLEGALLHSPLPMVVTVHDLIALKQPGERLRRGLRMRMRYLATQRAVRVVVPTKVVADDAIRSLEIPCERIEVIPEAAASVFHPRPDTEVAAVRTRYSLPDQYLLWVGGLKTPDPHKRVAALVKTKRSLPLVLVGPSGPWARELPDVTLTGEVPDDDLAAIYTGAHAVVFPSGDEGFGLTPVEALACGTPVAACDVPAVREVLDGRAVLLPCDDLDGLIRSAEAAKRPAPEPRAWTWEDAAEATWDVYELAARAPARWLGARH
ncbi:MAG TPA: glycosyltransferase [Solirubrobacteraceae bacterium]|jgi:alpha-1,3-rhamnosyl/mannosyltransferase|nr:glycosyltransferase [Solirubrobacteraceae bacterium]